MPYWAKCKKCDKRFLSLTWPRIENLLWSHFSKSHKLNVEEEFRRILKESAVIMKISRKVYEELKMFWKLSDYWDAVRKRPL